MLGWWKCNVWAVISQEQRLGQGCKVGTWGRRGLIAVQKSFLPLKCKRERFCPSRRNGQLDGIRLLVPSVLWSFWPWGCIPARVMWPCIPCRMHPIQRATLYGLSTVLSTIATKILQIVWHLGWNAYRGWIQWMEPPSRPRATLLHEFHLMGGQSDLGSDIEEAIDDNFFGMGSNVVDDIQLWSRNPGQEIQT